jgi:hypothetical protein
MREKLLVATRGAAAAFIEDMDHLREILNRQDPIRGTVRLLSNILRRLFIDKDLTAIAAPRIGRLSICAPDNRPYYAASKQSPFALFVSGGIAIFGIELHSAMISEVTSSNPQRTIDADPEATQQLSMHQFLSQDVLCLHGQWVNRGDTIKYVANTASGVHSGHAKNPADELIERLKRSVTFRVVDEVVRIIANLDVLLPDLPPFQYAPDSIDPTLLVILTSAHFLAISPDVMRLESQIRTELEQFPPPSPPPAP